MIHSRRSPVNPVHHRLDGRVSGDKWASLVEIRRVRAVDAYHVVGRNRPPEMWLDRYIRGVPSPSNCNNNAPTAHQQNRCDGIVSSIPAILTCSQRGVPRCNSSAGRSVNKLFCGCKYIIAACTSFSVWHPTSAGVSRCTEVCRGVTVYLRCADNLPPRRYVVVQLPRTDILNFCELEVYVRRMLALIFFTAWRYASAVVAVAVCPSVRRKSVLHRNDWTNRAGFCHGDILPPVLRCVIRKFWKNVATVSRSRFQQNSSSSSSTVELVDDSYM